MAEIKNYLPVILNNAITSFEDPTGLERPLWRDYSRYQGEINADIAAANGVLGAAHRATISYGYTDPFYALNYASLGRSGIKRTSYHVLYPDQSALRQADNWYKVQPVLDGIPRVIDLELKRNQAPAKIAAVTWDMVEIVKQRDGIPPILYSRYRLIDEWLDSWTQEMLDSIWYWLAQYSWFGYREHAGPPTLPKRVKRSLVVLHQTSDHKLAPAGEVKSKSVDWDRWEIGNEAQMNEWIRVNWGGGVVEPPEPIQAVEPIDHVRTTVNLNMRTLPSTSGIDIGTLARGSDVSITKRAGDWGLVEGWIKEEGYTEPYD
jgi:hypothetical protein